MVPQAVLAAMTSAALYAIHPYVIVESVNGMETAAAVFLLALTAWLYLRLVTGDAYKARRDGRTMDYICAREIRYLVDLEQEYWASSRCRDDLSLQLELVATIGRPLSYCRGGQVTVLELASMPEPPTTERSGRD